MTTIHSTPYVSLRSTHSVQHREATPLSNRCYEIAKQALKICAALIAGGTLGACIGILTGLPLVATITLTALTTLGIALLCSCSPAATPSTRVLPPSKKGHRKSTSSVKGPRSDTSTPRISPLQKAVTQRQQEPAQLATPVIPSFPQPQSIVKFPKDQPLPTTAAQLTIQEIASQTPSKTARSHASADAHATNIDMSLALISHYERWMKKIAANDFGITLPPRYVQAKIDDFLTVYGADLNERAAGCTTEQFQRDVLNPIYDRLHSPENRRQFVEECYQLQRIEEVKQTPRAYLERQLGYDLPESQAAEAMQQIQVELNQLTPETSLHEIESLQEKIRATLNARALQTLRNALHEEFGAAGSPFVEAIMNDWTYIGTDIKHNLSFLTPERMESIKERARAAFDKSTQLDEVLAQLQRDFQQGAPADEGLISAKYTTLDTLQQDMPQAKKLRVKAAITKALALQELRNKGRYNGTQVEKDLLTALGYSLDNSNDPSELHVSMGAFLAALGEHESAWSKSSRRLKQEIADYAFETRLMLAGVPRNSHDHVACLIQRAKKIYVRWNKHAHELQQQPIHEIQALERLPKARQRLLREIQARTRSALRKEITQSISHSRESIINNPNDWIPPTGDKLSLLIQPSYHLTPETRNKIAWLHRYQDTFLEEFSQNENPQDILLRGVCFGKSCGLAHAVLHHPETPWHQLQPGKILPQDRFFQSAYTHHLAQTKKLSIDDVRLHSIPETLKQMKGIDFRPVCIMINATPDKLFNELKSNLSEIQQSNGGLIVSTSRHAIFMRIDTNRGIFELTDSNFGYQTFSLENPPGQALDDVIKRMAACVIELADQIYHESLISISQLVKKQGTEKRPDSFYRCPIIE